MRAASSTSGWRRRVPITARRRCSSASSPTAKSGFGYRPGCLWLEEGCTAARFREFTEGSPTGSTSTARAAVHRSWPASACSTCTRPNARSAVNTPAGFLCSRYPRSVAGHAVVEIVNGAPRRQATHRPASVLLIASGPIDGSVALVDVLARQIARPPGTRTPIVPARTPLSLRHVLGRRRRRDTR